MSSEIANDVKKSVKEAKKSIQDKDYQAALEHCDAALGLDGQNYNALVFKALALQETSQLRQAVDAFEKAIAIDPQQLLAFKGLSGYYEKHPSPENCKKLISVYKSLEVLLKSDTEKRLDVITKLINLAKSCGDITECVNALTILADIHVSLNDKSAEFHSWNDIISYVLSLQNSSSYHDILENAFAKALLSSSEARLSESDLNNLRNQHLMFLKLKGSILQTFELAKLYLIESNNDIHWVTYICQLFIESVLSEKNLEKIFDLVEIKELALILQEQGEFNNNIKAIGNLTQGAVLYCEMNYIKSLPLIIKGLSENSKLLEGWVLLSKIHYLIHNYKESEIVCVSGLEIIAKLQTQKTSYSELIITLLCLNLSRALIGLARFNDAKQTLTRSRKKVESTINKDQNWIMDVESDLLECEACIAIRLNNLEEALNISEKLVSRIPHAAYIIQAKIHLMNKDYVKAETQINLALEIKETSEALHILSVIQWEYGLDCFTAVQNILRACKGDPYYGRNYLFLGHFYKKQSNLNRAEQCYQKAFELDPYDEQISLCLSNFLSEVQKTDLKSITEHVKTLKSIAKYQPRVQWVWFRLGLSYLKMGQNQLNLAIQSFQNAIRIDENDSKSWECLGDAYLLQGSYGASLNAFNKLVQLKPDDIYSAFQVSKNKQLLELYTEASEAYREIIKTNSKYIPACLGLAECQFFMAKDYFRQSLFGLAKQLASEALVFLNLRVFPCKSNYVSLYKLAGDLTVLLASLGSNHLPIELPCQLYGLPKRDTTFSMLDLLTSANCCYGRATAIKPEIPTLWHDLGLSYYLSSQCHTESSIAKRVSEKSLACFRKALELNPINPTYWMSMGVVSATTKLENGFAFAQHCFIKTLQLDPKNVTAWSNLGVLYLMNENLALANEAFSRGQSVDPSNEIPWIGQALIAETMGHEQTLELFRHSSILKPNTEGVLGYAHWLISQLVQKSETSVKNINPELDYKTRWITQAVDGLVKLTATEKTKAEAFHYLALALERQKLFKPAAYAARLSYKLLKEGQPSIQNLEASKVNLARILRLAGSKEESLSLLTEIKNPDTSIYCETALAFLETGSPEKAFQAYEMALKVCEEKSHHLQADILTAMAFVVRKIPGFEDQAKTYLFKGVNCQSQSIPGLLALCALGFLNSDSILINAALSELEQYKYNLNYWPKIAHLLAINKAIQGDTESAIRQLCKAIYWQPASSELWSHLAKFLLLAGGNRSTKATQCAKNAWIHSPKNYNDLDQTFTMVSSFLAAGDIKSSRSLALRAVHYQPDNAKSWCCLLATSMANPSKHKSIEIITRCVEKLSDSWFKLPTANLFLKDWLDATLLYNRLSNNSSKTIANVSMEIDTNSIGKNTYVAKHLERALAEKDVASYLKNILNEDETVVSQSVVWTTLIKTQLNDAQYKEAEENICQWLQILENGEMPTEEKIIPLLYLSLLAKEAMHVKNDQLEHWINLGKEASTQATKLMKDCHVAHFLLALFQLNSVGKEASKLAKKSLEKSILSSKESKETSLNFEIATKKLLSHIMEINLSSQNK